MSTGEKLINHEFYACYAYCAQLNVDQVVAASFEHNALTFGLGLEQERVIARIRMSHFTLGMLSPETDERLKQFLIRQLEIAVRHSRIWLQEDPDPVLLGDIHHEQAEAMREWGVFHATYKATQGNLEIALAMIETRAPLEPLAFDTKEAGEIWRTALKNEQQRLIGKAPQTAIRLESEWQGLVQKLTLSPALSGLLALLASGHPQPVRKLLRDVYQVHRLDPDTKNHLSRRISELNMAIFRVFGPPPQGKRWIEKVIQDGEDCYRLQKPGRSLIA
jgi:hypothetical protein